MEQPILTVLMREDRPEGRTEFFVEMADGGMIGRSCIAVGRTEAAAKKRAIANLELLVRDLKGVPR